MTNARRRTAPARPLVAHRAAAGLLAALLVRTPAAQQEPGFVAGYLAEARAALDQGELAAARLAVERALERDDKSLPALALLADLAQRQQDVDRAVHALHRWLDVFDARPGKTAAAERKATFDRLLPLDGEAPTWSRLQATYVKGLLELGKQYRAKKDLLCALEVYQSALLVAPDHPEALAAIHLLRTTGGREVAVEDAYAGSDPTGGLSEAELQQLDQAHADWEHAYTDQSDNYRYRTDAGFLVLKTSRLAMEQMNGFYRRFFHFMEDGGKTPAIEIRVFRDRDEYLRLGRSPQPWSAGQFTGDAVETYAPGRAGKASVREMYQTLFHEAAHQFVSMTGPMVPGWLNEAYASFFEGCVMLSNGTVKWNRVPPGRLFPLAKRLQHGWMQSPDEAAPGADGEWRDPAGAPSFRMVVAGGYRWGPPWYAPTWGVVYFLYNFRLDDGRLVFRDALHAYYQSFKRGQPKDAAAHFEATVLAASPLSPVATLTELDAVWKRWILRLADRENGVLDAQDELMAWANAALARKDPAAALEFLEDARDLRPADAEVLWLLATTLETQKQRPQAAARYREFRRALEVAGKTADARFAAAQKRIESLDPLLGRARALEQKFADDGLALAKGYEARQLPTMALEIARRMSAGYSIRAAMDYYEDLARRTGRSLARWRVAYDERSLAGWSGGDDGAFQAYGKLLRAEVARDGARMVTRELTCDVPFDADFSLAAELQVPDDPAGGFAGDLLGLCFGRKGDQQYHAVLLHPKGFLDISSNRGGEWSVHDHRSLPVGSAWHSLRIDVTGQQLDVYYDGLFVRTLLFPDAAALRGSFGLLCGPGRGQFRNVRLLARDPFDPAARIERALAMVKVMSDPGQRQPGTFSGFVPPELGPLDFVQGAPMTLGDQRGRPVMLVFWSPAQDRVIPCTSWLRHTLTRTAAKGLVALVVSDAGTTADDLRTYLSEQPLPGAVIAADRSGATYDAFFVKAGFFGMPRVLLLDRDGKVVFEGDPGLTRGQQWSPADGPTFVDQALDKLLQAGPRGG